MNLAKKITNRVFKRWSKEGKGMPEILEDELHKIGVHGAVGFVTKKGLICAECNRPIKHYEKDTSKIIN